MFRMCTEALRVWDHAKEAFQQIAREPVFLDEGHAGAVLASAHELQRCKDILKADLKQPARTLRQHAKTTETC